MGVDGLGEGVGQIGRREEGRRKRTFFRFNGRGDKAEEEEEE
jgi:hypothetical protein